jgi:hypothetical protein
MRLRVLLATTLVATACSADPAFAAPFSLSFDWAGSPATGFFGWQRTDQLPTPGANPPFLPPYYASVRSGAAPGIRLAPSPAADGTRDRIYSNYDASTQSGGPKINEIYTAPGTTTIARARIRDVSFLNDSEGQILRAAITDQTGAFAAESAYGMDDGSPLPGPFLPGVTYSNVVLPELFWPGYATGIPSRLELSLRTICVPAGNCPLVHFQPDGTPMSSGRFGTVELDLIDPEAPSLNLGGSLTTSSSWVNTNRSGRLTFTAQDPGSGVRKLRLERRGSSATTILLNETIACDLTHRSPPPGTLPGGACPAQADRSVSQSVSQNGVTTFTATASDLSGQSTTQQSQIRIDRQRPTARLSGSLRSLAGHWTNRTDPVGVTVTGSDALSGVSKLQIAESGGSASVAEALVCTSGSGPGARCAPASSSSLAVGLAGLRDGRRTLRPVATDLAGNRSATAPGVTLLLDRRAPAVPRNVRLVRTGSGARATFTRAASDGGSPIAATEIRFASGTGPVSAWRTTLASSANVAGDRTNGIRVELRSVDAAGNRSRGVRADLPPGARTAAGPPTCQPGRRCPRRPQRARSLRHRFADRFSAARARTRGRADCLFYYEDVPDLPVDARPAQFRAENTRIGLHLQAGKPRGTCRESEIIDVLRLTYTITHRASGENVVGPRRRTYNPGDYSDDVYWTCRPDLDGVQTYDLFLRNVSGLTQPVKGKPKSISASPRARRTTFQLPCPTQDTRQDREIAAWRALAGYNPANGTVSTAKDQEGAGRGFLRGALKNELPRGPSKAWEAHHIIPLRDMPKAGRPVVAAAFRCKQYPNSATNGVYLRSMDWAKNTLNYFSIPDLADRARTWHPFTKGRFLGDYFARLRRAFVRSGAIDDGKGTCRRPGTFRGVLAKIKADLRRGTFILPSPPETP